MNPFNCHRIVALLLCWASAALAQTPFTVAGKVMGYLANPMGDYDGLRLRTATGEIRLRFPPHTAARVMKLATTGSTIEAIADRRPPGPHHSEKGDYMLISLNIPKSRTVVRLTDLPPPPPRPGRLVETEGPLISKLYDTSGQLIGLITDHYIIELKPHQREQLRSILANVDRLGATGYPRPTDGFVNRSGRPLLRPTTLTIRGQTFVLE